MPISRSPLFSGKEKTDERNYGKMELGRRIKFHIQQSPISFYFMVATFILLMLNLYVTRSNFSSSDVRISNSRPEQGSAPLNEKRNVGYLQPNNEESDGTTDYNEEDQSAKVPNNFFHDYRDEDGGNVMQDEEESETEEVPTTLPLNLGLRGASSVEESMRMPFPNLMDLTDEQLFENYADLKNAPDVFVPSFPQKRSEWWGVQDYVRMYQKHPIKRFIPVLNRNIQMNQETFTQRFRKFGVPLLFRMDNLRKAGFQTHAWTFDELRELFPFDRTMEGKTFNQYRPNARFDNDEVDLGPGLAAISEDGEIVRKNGLRNFPRNMKVKAEALRKLGVQWPPLIPQRWRQRPSLWMGTSTSGTAFHSDCCDNFVAMIAGTKRITLAPPSDFHLLSPRCVGKNKGLCYANIPEPNKPGVSSSHYNKMIVDVKPGEILWMPAGWFHHIENLGPTLMYNTWSFGEQTAGVVSCNKRWST